MRELDAKLKEIEQEIEQLSEITRMLQRENSIFECFDRVTKEVM